MSKHIWIRPAAALTSVLALCATLLVAQPARALIDSSQPEQVWRPNSGTAYALARVGNMIVVGGTFTQMVSPAGARVTRNRIAAIDATTGELLAWNPNSDGEVRTVTGSADGTVVFVGGTFNNIGGAARTNLAALSASTGRATSFTANTNATVRVLKLVGDSLFVGGIFWRISGSNRGGGAELNAATGALRGWDPKTNNGIYGLEVSPDGTAVFVGGPFTRVSGVAHDYMAKTARANGDLFNWDAGFSCADPLNPCVVYDIIADGADLYLGMGGPGGRVTKLDAATGRQYWWAGTDGDVQTIALDGRRIYAGGHFADTFSGFPRAGLASLDTTNGAVLAEASALVSGGTGVWKVVRDGDRLRFAGNFSTIAGAAIGRYSSYPILPDPDDTTPPATPSGFRAPSTLADQVTLSWNAAADNVTTTKYVIRRNGAVIGESNYLEYKDRTVAANTTYTYTVQAVDYSGNAGNQSAPVTARTEVARDVLLARAAQWRFYSRGLDPGASWIDPDFNDSGWVPNVGEFGYGDGDEDTYISPLGVVHYFRTTFEIANVSYVTTPNLRLLLDDGAVVYLNGSELTRVGMPTGPVTNTTTALNSIGGTAEMTYATIPIDRSRLRSGSNTLAISVHNQSATSSDVSMDAFISYTSTAPPAPPAAPADVAAENSSGSVLVTWSPVPGATSYKVWRDGVQVGTSATTSYLDSAVAFSTTYTYTVVAVGAGGDSTPSSAATVTTPDPPSEPPAAPTGLTATPNGQSVSLSWIASAGATGYQVWRDGVLLAPAPATTYTDLTVAGGATYVYTVKAVNQAGSSPDSEPASATVPEAPIMTYTAPGDTWRYLDAGATPAADWQAAGFDDSSWKAGPTEAGYGEGDEATALAWGSDPNRKPITFYARRTFEAGSVNDVIGLALRAVLDDAAVVYLNGVEIWRYNLPAGAITATTRASTAISGAAETRWNPATLPATALLAGTNVLAVEVHQDAPSSSDASFNLELLPRR